MQDFTFQFWFCWLFLDFSVLLVDFQVSSYSTRQSLSSRQAVIRLVRKTSGSHQARQADVRHSSGSRQSVVRQLSGSRQAVVRQSSGSHQAVVRQLTDIWQVIIRLLCHRPGLYPLEAVVTLLLVSYLAVIKQSSGNCQASLGAMFDRHRQALYNDCAGFSVLFCISTYLWNAIWFMLCIMVIWVVEIQN